MPDHLPTPAAPLTPAVTSPIPTPRAATPPAGKPWPKRLLFRLHWAVGLTLGLVLAVMGVTGALMAYEDPLMRVMSPGIITVAPPDTTPPPLPRLTPDALLARVRAQRPDQPVATLILDARPDRAARVRLGADRAHMGLAYVDPYDGTLLGPARGERFFATVRRIHRWLALPGGPNGVGRSITGAAAVALLFLGLSGLYLRWPHRPLSLRPWLRLEWRGRGRVLYRSLHTVVGTWVLPVYLVFSLTGLWWSYAGYRNAVSLLLTGSPAGAHDAAPAMGTARADGHDSAPPRAVADGLDTAWSAFLARTGGHYLTATLAPPGRAGQPVTIRYQAADADHEHAVGEMVIDGASGAILRDAPYDGLPLGKRLLTSLLDLHRGSFFGWGGTLLFMLAALSMPMFTLTGLLLYIARRRAGRKAARARTRR